MLDRDLAALYETETKALNLAVKRNITRFPNDFMFQLTREEYEILRFQFETSINDSNSLNKQIVLTRAEAATGTYPTLLRSRESLG